MVRAGWAQTVGGRKSATQPRPGAAVGSVSGVKGSSIGSPQARSDSPLRAVAETRKGWVLRPSEVSFRMLAHARRQTMSSLPTRSRLATDCRREGQPASPRAGRARLIGCESSSSEGRTRQIGFACFGTTPRGENNARRKRSVMADRQRHGARFAARLSLCLALHQTHNGLLCSIPHRAPAAGATQSA